MFCTLGTRLLGFAREALVNGLFGAGSEADVLRTVFRIPNNMRKLLAEGALSSAFIPELSRQLVDDGSGEKAKSLTASIMGLLLIITIPLTMLFIIFPGPAVNLLTEFSDPAQTALAVKLLPYLITYIFFVSISALLMGVLNSHNRFFIPAVTPLLFSVAVISSLLVFHRTMGIFSMAVGVIAGGIGQILFQLGSFRSLGYRLLPSLDFNTPEFRRVMKKWGPILITSSIFSVNQFIAGYFATMLPEGSVSALDNAIVFWQLPFGLFVNSFITVAYPKMSRQAAKGDRKGLRDTLHYGWNGLMTLLLPSSAGLMLLGIPIISVAMQRGAFDAANTILASRVLFAYCTGLIFVGAYNFTQRAFYALGDYKTPITAALFVVAVDILFTVLFLFLWNRGVEGLAYANSLAYLAGLSFYIFRLRLTIPLDGSISIMLNMGKILISLLPGTGYVFLLNRFLGVERWLDGSSLANLGYLALYGLGYVLSTLFSYKLAGVEFLSIINRKTN
jgi:putative peptidoglycan lipid II flippase